MATEAKHPAPKGFFPGTRMGHQSAEMFHQPSATVTRFPYGSFSMGKPHASIIPSGTRAIHGGQPLSESAKIVSNRPLSPNLILKKPQLSATYSISHRIFGAALASGILLTPILMKFSVIFDV